MRELSTFTEWKNHLEIYPQSWDDLGMDWNNPDPFDSVYWLAITQAIFERFYSVWDGEEPSSFYRQFGSILINYKYETGLSNALLVAIKESIIYLSRRYIDTEKTDYENIFVKEELDSIFPRVGYNFPKVLNWDVYSDDPIILNVSEQKDSPTTIQDVVEFMKACRKILGKMTQTVFGEVWCKRPHAEIMAIFHPQQETYSDLIENFNSWQQNYKSQVDTKYFFTSIDGLGYTSNFRDLYSFTGLMAYQMSKNTQNQYTYRYEGQIKMINQFGVYNQLGLKKNLKLYIYVSTDVAICDEDDMLNTYEPYTFGYQEGLTVVDKGQLPDYPIDLSLITVSDLPNLYPSEVEHGIYEGDNSYPTIMKRLLKGCNMAIVPVIDYAVEGGFRFKA